MLIRFNVKNVLSFNTNTEGKSEELSMIAGKARLKQDHLYSDNNIKLLKLACIYGANAAGKSNLIKALYLMKLYVLNEEKVAGNKYCKCVEGNIDRPSYFEVEIELNGKYYAYGFEIILNKGEFVSEWLYELKKDNSEVLIFERDIKSSEYKFGTYLKNSTGIKNLEIYMGDIVSDKSVLFLSIMNNKKDGFYSKFSDAFILRDVFNWFAVSLQICFPDSMLCDYTHIMEDNGMDLLTDFLYKFDTGISKVSVKDVPRSELAYSIPSEILNQARDDFEEILRYEYSKNENKGQFGVPYLFLRNKKKFFLLLLNENAEIAYGTLVFEHSDGKEYTLEEESDGTVRLVDLIEILLAPNDSTIVVDELERCLHPVLTYNLIKYYLDIAKEKNIQLIATTHESRLLDLDLMRRDEIWFVEKGGDGTSHLYSLEEYNERFDKKIDNAYLDGRYGGIPRINGLF